MVVYSQQYLVSKTVVEVVSIVASLVIWKLSFVTVTLNEWLAVSLSWPSNGLVIGWEMLLLLCDFG